MIKNRVGQRTGKLTAIKYLYRKPGSASYWLYRCDCGNEYIGRSNSVDYCKRIASCGCLYRNELNGTKFYRTYFNMKSRCENPKHTKYHYYGKRGIKCLWNNVNDFIKDMHKSYIEHEKLHGSKNTTLDRIDVNGNYCKENCRWATLIEQRNNRTDS